MIEELTQEYIMSLGTFQAYNEWLLRGGKKGNEKKYNAIRYGIKIPFDIYDIENNLLILEPTQGRYVHKALRRSWKSNYIHTELEERTLLIKEELIKMIPEKNSTKTR